MRSITYALLVAAAIAGGGCASQEKHNGEVKVPDPRGISGENREWWDVYSVEFHGDRKVRDRVGYLYRKYDSRNPKGFYWVRDLTHKDLGFLLSDHKAFLIVSGKPQPLGTTDLIGGVKRILQAPGTVELEKVLPRSSSGAPAISSSAR